MSRRLLVTGGAGFIGSRIAVLALDAEWDVRVLDSLRDDVHGGEPRLSPHIEFVRGDVRDPDVVARALQGIDAVCHQAAKVGLGLDIGEAPDYVSSNDLGTAVLLAGMAASGVSRLVVASSMVVYGEGSYTLDGRPTRPAPRRYEDLEAGRFDPVDPDSGRALEPTLIDEDDALDPRSVYAVSKLAQESLTRVWSRETTSSVAALRYHNVYGPGMPQNTPYAGVASLFRSALERGESPVVYEDGCQRRDFVHVDDVARANLAALAWTEEGREWRAFNIGSDVVHTVGDLATALSGALGGPEPRVTGAYRTGDVRHITASSRRAFLELDWRANRAFEDGVAEFAHAPLREAVR